MANVMKYLKRFNESNDVFIDKLEDFCEKNLAYLLDDGYYFNISDNGDYSKIRITNRGKDIIWDNFKDDFLPFLELLEDKYIIDNRETEEVLIWARPKPKHGGQSYSIAHCYYFSIDELLNGEMENCGYPNFRPDLIRTIEIDVLNSEK